MNTDNINNINTLNTGITSKMTEKILTEDIAVKNMYDYIMFRLNDEEFDSIFGKYINGIKENNTNLPDWLQKIISIYNNVDEKKAAHDSNYYTHIDLRYEINKVLKNLKSKNKFLDIIKDTIYYKF